MSRLARSSGVCTLPDAAAGPLGEARDRCARLLAAAASSSDPRLRAAAARDERCHPALRTRLRADPDPQVRWAPPAAAEAMASDREASVRLAAAQCPQTSARTLRRLAADRDVCGAPGCGGQSSRRWVAVGAAGRAVVADNSAHRSGGTSPTRLCRWLRRLASDPSTDARAAVGRNRSTPPDVLDALCAGEGYYPAGAVAANPSAWPDTLRRLARDGVNLEGIAANASCPSDVLDDVALGRCMHEQKCDNDACQRDADASRCVVYAGVLDNPSTDWGLKSHLDAYYSDDLDMQIAAGHHRETP